MASPEHCIYCFESLASHLEKRKGLSLKEIQQSWPEYARTALDDAASGPPKKQIPALHRLAAEPGASSDTGSASSGSSVSLAADTPATSTESLSEASPASAIEESPLFVTWNTLVPSRRRSGSGSVTRSLRGCIGTFEAQDLASGLSEYALTSALHDMRFPPIDEDELPTLEAAVTLLTDFEDADGPTDWDLGTHGLRISFFVNGKRYGATYLPDVAVEQEWTKEETIVSLMRKAGWVGKRDKWRDIELKVVRYQGKKESLGYEEYRKWREWVEGKSAA